MTNFENPAFHPEHATNSFYNATTDNTQTTSAPCLVGINTEWIWLILIALVFLNSNDFFGSSDGKSSNTLILMMLAFFFFANTASHN